MQSGRKRMNLYERLCSSKIDHRDTYVFTTRARSRKARQKSIIRTDVLMDAMNKLPSLAEEFWENRPHRALGIRHRTPQTHRATPHHTTLQYSTVPAEKLSELQ
jgi:hypothetical protein